MQLDGRLLGVVYLDSQVAKGIFTADDFGIITALTNYIASSLETARAAQLEISVQTAQRARHLAETLREAQEKMSELLHPVDVIKQLLEATAQVLGSDQALVLKATVDECSLMAVAPQTGELVMHSIAEDVKLRTLLSMQKPRVGTAETIPAALKDRLANSTSWIALPLRSSEADLGVLVLAASTPTSLSESMAMAATLVAQGMTAHDKATLFQRVKELSVVDELTGIANRRRFFEVATRDLANAARHERELTALMIDIDHFKRVNDTFGHPTGDDVIQSVAALLSAQVRQTDAIGRYGGEEFAVLLQDAGPGNELPERLRACVAEQPIKTRSGLIPVTVSVGLAYLSKEDVDIEGLLARADQALYQAKEQGRNRVCVSLSASRISSQ
jgi:diguanylate cyclase (GGDEF)-like protein